MGTTPHYRASSKRGLPMLGDRFRGGEMRNWCIAIILASTSATAAAQSAPLRPPSDFASIADERARSQALFKEAGRVIQSPRCLNCHPVTRRPTQGDDVHAHVPPMYGGPAGSGVASLPCFSCHGRSNMQTFSKAIPSIPGNERWQLAPASMAWQGKSLPQICDQLKDRARNGDHSLAEIHEHAAKDALVGWAWHPGDGRVPAPGTQKQFGELIGAWISTGAHCPAEN